MKKNVYIKLFLIAFTMNFINCKSQTEIVWGQKNQSLPEDFQNTGNYYYKDVHNYLDNFVGTWEYINGNEKFQIVLTKVIKYHDVKPLIDLDIYKDGITLQYKKFVNGSLVYESPISGEPELRSESHEKLSGYITDYGRQTVEITRPAFFGGGIQYPGGQNFHPKCRIEKLLTSINEPAKISFKLYLGERDSSFGSPYDNPAYYGLPIFSIPNDIVMTKVP